ncbi:hypothetical protein KKP88_00545 [Methanothermococcus sp. SCGC AD-155-K20]|nr:hypothetical protein [Methanothermococcus sp. SCGC AD-155-K20]
MIEIISYQEIKGNNENIVKEEFEKLVNEIKSKYKCDILSVEEDLEDGIYTLVAELKISFNSFLEYVKFPLIYSADLDVIEPPKLKVDHKEFGEALAYIITFFKNFYERYNVAFNIPINENITINLEDYKKGIYDEDEVFAFEEEEGLIKAKAVFEGYGTSEEEVIKRILLSLEDNVIINKVITKELEKEGPYKNVGFYGLIAVELFCKPLDIIEIAYKFLPVVVSIRSESIELDSLELQDIGNELGGVIFELTHTVVMGRL